MVKQRTSFVFVKESFCPLLCDFSKGRVLFDFYWSLFQVKDNNKQEKLKAALGAGKTPNI